MSQRRRGFSLIDVIVGISLLLVLFLVLFGVLRASLAVSSLAKAKSAAIELASTQMEYMHGLSYDTLGTVGGIPAGPIPQTATVSVDGVPYTVRTFIEYYDDPADGIGSLDTNGITTDYKLGKVTVSYAVSGVAKSVALASNFVPPGIESSTGGGALSLHVVDATGADVGGATVHIVNNSIAPAVDLTTFSNTSGIVFIDGAAPSPDYQIYVSRTGYSSAQTYARAGNNTNPTPGYLTVAKDQTTGATFAIDRLATLILSSFSPAVTSAFTDSFADTSKLSNQSNTQVTGSMLTLANQMNCGPGPDCVDGSALSMLLSPSALSGWGILSATITLPIDTTAVVRVDDAAGTPLPDSVLPGNSAGFSSFPISLTDIATSSYPGLKLEADLTSTATTSYPALLNWSLSYTMAPTPLPNTGFTLTGAKTIGTDSGGLSIYKTIVTDTTGTSASKAETLEWDAYTLALTSGNLIESCPASPYPLSPAQTLPASLLVGAPTGATLPVVINNSTGGAIGGARVVLGTNGYAATVLTSACGLAYFNGLTDGTYSATVSAAGHATTTFPGISVNGNTAPATFTLP